MWREVLHQLTPVFWTSSLWIRWKQHTWGDEHQDPERDAAWRLARLLIRERYDSTARLSPQSLRRYLDGAPRTAVALRIELLLELARRDADPMRRSRAVEEAVALALQSGDVDLEAAARLCWARLQSERGDLAAALQTLAGLADRSDRLIGPRLVGWALAAAYLAWITGDLDAAEAYLRQAEGAGDAVSAAQRRRVPVHRVFCLADRGLWLEADRLLSTLSAEPARPARLAALELRLARAYTRLRRGLWPEVVDELEDLAFRRATHPGALRVAAVLGWALARRHTGGEIPERVLTRIGRALAALGRPELQLAFDVLTADRAVARTAERGRREEVGRLLRQIKARRLEPVAARLAGPVTRLLLFALDEDVEREHALGVLRYLVQTRPPGADLPRLDRAADRRRLARVWQRVPESRPLLSQFLPHAGTPGPEPGAWHGLRVRVLGGLRIEMGGRDVTPPGRLGGALRDAVRLLLLLLLVRNPMPFDEVHEYLWPDLAAEAALARLYRAGHALRKLLGLPSDAVKTSRAGAALHAADPWVDALAFLDLAAKPGTERAAGEDATRWRQAIELYRGPLLPGVNDIEPLNELRERLATAYVDTRLRLMDLARASGSWDEVVAHAQEILEADPYREEAYLALVRAHAARGDRLQAARVIREYLRVCREELAADPHPEVKQLAAGLDLGLPR